MERPNTDPTTADHPLEDQSPRAICGIADALRPGDDVRVGQRTRTLTVCRREDDHGTTAAGHQPPDYPYREVWLTDNGTEYRLRYSYRGEAYPVVHAASELERATHGGHDRIEATDGSGETVEALSPAAVSDVLEMSDWVVDRLVTEETVDE